MPPTTKEAQRAELHKGIWRTADDLRGSVEGQGLKSSVLGMPFYCFFKTAFCDEAIATTGAPIAEILPPASPFAGDGAQCMTMRVVSSQGHLVARWKR